MNRLKNKKITLGALITFLTLNSQILALPSTNFNPAGQLQNQQQQQFEQLKKQQEIKTFKEQSKEEIKTSKSKEAKDEASGVKFNLKKIVYPKKSQVLTEAELKAITSKYENKSIDINDLYIIVDEINNLYTDKGYIVCRAILPEQTIEEGIVKITLIEGKTGKVKVENNKSTKESYIKKRISLIKDKVSNVLKLNNKLLWFNNTNDVQVKVKLKPGEELGTTDYILEAYEPKRHQFYSFIDNRGSESSGEYRYVGGYVNKSLFGYRDQLNIGGIISEGSRGGNFSYSLPLSTKGTKLELNYSVNDLEIIKGDLKDSDVTGDSSSYGIFIKQPLYISTKHKVEGRFGFRKQKSSTDFMDMPWVDDEIKDWELGLSSTWLMTNALFYQDHLFTLGKYIDILNNESDYFKYNFTGIYQKTFSNKSMFTGTLSGQYTNDSYLPSSSQFYAGGGYSVRGYAESFMGGDTGASLSLEYEKSLNDSLSALIFADAGYISGKTVLEDNKIYGVGVGVKAKVLEKLYLNLQVGVPLKKKYNGERIDSYRCYFTINYLF